MAQVWESPALMTAINFLPEGGVLRLLLGSPQQTASLSGVMPQVWELPALMAINFLPGGGVLRPLELLPQQAASLSAVMAQLWNLPALTLLT